MSNDSLGIFCRIICSVCSSRKILNQKRKEEEEEEEGGRKKKRNGRDNAEIVIWEENNLLKIEYFIAV